MNWKPAIVLPVSLLMLTVVGCTSPPAVTPLLDLSCRAMTDEAVRLRQDAEADAAGLDRTRASLASAFAADLHQRGELDAEWVLEAATVYVAAREAVLDQELKARAQRHARADNLEAAAEATRRAIHLLQQRDRLFDDTRAAQLWRILGGETQGASR